MAGICSAHYGYEKDCPRCNSSPAQLLGLTEKQWAEEISCAEIAGRHTCQGCGFVYYKTVDSCPKCSRPRVNIITTTNGSWWTAVLNWLGITGK